MIYDAENIFMKKQDLSAATVSDILYNGNGDAYAALWLYAQADAALSDAAAITIQTADTEDMTDAETLGTLSLAKDEGSTASMRLPKGAKKYLRLSVSGAATGTITAALVLDTELE